MKLAAFDDFRETTTRQRYSTAWIAEWVAGEVRQSTGMTLADVNADGYNSVMIMLPPDVVSRLAEVARDMARIAELVAE